MLDAGCRDRQQLQLKTQLTGALLQERNRLFAIRAVMVDQGNFFAFELVHAAFFFANLLHQHVSGQPIRASQWEVPFENGTVLAFTAAIACGDERYLVARGFFSQCKSGTGRQGLEHRGAAIFTL